MLKVSTSFAGQAFGDTKVTSILMGEIHPGSLVLLTGESDTGKSVLCRQLAYNALCGNVSSVAYFTTQKRTDELLDQMESFSFHVHYYFVSDRFRVYSLRPLNQTLDVEGSFRLLLDCLDRLTSPFNLAVVDDINPLLANMTPAKQVMALRDIKAICRRNSRSVIMVTNPYVFSRNSLSRLYSISDYFLKADIVPALPGLEQMDCRTMRMLELGKVAGVEMAKPEIVHFEIRAGTGVHILPYVTVKA